MRPELRSEEPAHPCGAVLLSAGNVSHKLPFLRPESTCPALIPIGMKTAVSHQMQFFLPRCKTILVVTNEEDVSAVREELQAESQVEGSEVCVLGYNTSHVNETLLRVLPELQKRDVKSWVVAVVTTIPTVFPECGDVLLASDPSIPQKWSAVKFDGDSVRFVSRDAASNQPSFAFTGVFHLSLDILVQAVRTAEGSDLLGVVASASDLCSLRFRHMDWIDVGHNVNYHAAKTKLIAARSFNSISVDLTFGVLKKTSANASKLADENSYVEMLPKKLQVLFPRRLGGLQQESNSASILMEYYAYPTLAELALFWQLDEGQWASVFNALDRVLLSFREYRYQIGREAFRDFYYGKLVARLTIFMDSLLPEIRSLLDRDAVVVNGQKCLAGHALLQKIERRLDRLYSVEDFAVMHGDLCFNNILYEPYSGTLRLIDARGSFGDACVGVYGDIKYDIAKLAHSAIWSYDYFIAGLFELDVTEAGIGYRFRHRRTYSIIQSQCRDLIAKLRYSQSDIDFIVGLLFLSMTPIHDDDRKRQIGMYAHGLYLTNGALEI